MRNEAMEPFYDTLPDNMDLSRMGNFKPKPNKPWTGIVFYNDVFLGATHFLEVIHQHIQQNADMTCGWDHNGKYFYDGWVGRDLSGRRHLYSRWIERRDTVDWIDKPPAKVKCHDWPDALGKSHNIWNTLRWVDSPKLEIPAADKFDYSSLDSE
ncbi:uncharacterized protein IL334_007749 [Kwoniella shivajii]|uniref:Uncharacterized protein n=1 Tax=Kwoniella shivajii TaxID=564305 RepID=A0ABZ1D9I5_9TREE|nr:hypothetical protein IL334_007749 [Kwoniella shivajii]